MTDSHIPTEFEGPDHTRRPGPWVEKVMPASPEIHPSWTRMSAEAKQELTLLAQKAETHDGNETAFLAKAIAVTQYSYLISASEKFGVPLDKLYNLLGSIAELKGDGIQNSSYGLVEAVESIRAAALNEGKQSGRAM